MRCLLVVVSALAVLSPAPRALAAPTNFVGLNTHVPSNDVLDAVKASGATWIRIDFNWLMVEPQQGQYDWTLFDKVVNEARSRGLQVFASIGYGPPWASAGGSDGRTDNDVPKAGLYQSICQKAAAHFAGRITHWGLWNEPNLDFFEGTMQQWIDRVVLEGVRGIKAGCASCKVLGPEMASVGNLHDVWLDAALKALKQNGLMFDIITWHDYSTFKAVSPNWACWSGDLFVHDLDELRVCVIPVGRKPVRQVLLDNGLGNLPLWITETGYKAPAGDASAEALQATYYRRVLEEQLKRPWWTHTFFYEILDDNNIADKWGVTQRSSKSWPGGYTTKKSFSLLQKVLGTNPEFGGSGAACDDGLDNDGDGLVDSADPGCSGTGDNDERDGVADGGADGPTATLDAAPPSGDGAPAKLDGAAGADAPATRSDAGASGADGGADGARNGGGGTSSGCNVAPGAIDVTPVIALFLLMFIGTLARRR